MSTFIVSAGLEVWSFRRHHRAVPGNGFGSRPDQSQAESTPQGRFKSGTCILDGRNSVRIDGGLDPGALPGASTIRPSARKVFRFRWQPNTCVAGGLLMGAKQDRQPQDMRNALRLGLTVIGASGFGREFMVANDNNVMAEEVRLAA